MVGNEKEPYWKYKGPAVIVEIVECIRCPKVDKILLKSECIKCEHFHCVQCYEQRSGMYVSCKYVKPKKIKGRPAVAGGFTKTGG